MMFTVKHRDGTVIDRLETLAEAEECVQNLEQSDKENDTYDPSSYSIVEE